MRSKINSLTCSSPFIVFSRIWYVLDVDVVGTLIANALVDWK